MARMPGAIWKPLPGSSTTKMSAYDITCFHTMVGSLDGTDNYFRTQATGTNSHFGVGGDGTIYQWVDTAYRSGANLNGNYHIISAETADMGAPFGPWSSSDVPAWTQAQIEANATIAKWAHDTHGIPLTEIPDAKPGRRGVGYHRLGVPGYMVAGAEQWSSSKGKVCPGDRRVSQVPAIIAAANGGTHGGFLMALTDAQQQEIYDWLKGGAGGEGNNVSRIYWMLKGGKEGPDLSPNDFHWADTQQIARAKDLAARVDALTAAVAKLQAGGVDPAEVAKLVLAGLNGTTLNVTAPTV